MKRIVLGGMIALVVLGLAGLGLAVARPDLVPAWARLGPAPEARRTMRACTARSTGSRRSSAPSATRS